MPGIWTFGAGTERPRALLVGCGGAGCNTLRAIPPESGLDTLAVNDLPHASLVGIRHRLFLPKSGLRELVAMDDRAVKTLATTPEQAVALELGDAEFVGPLAGLGGEMGSWGASLVARVAALKGAMTLAVATMPFSAEGPDRRAVAGEALKVLRTHAHGVVALPNDPLLRVAPHLPFQKAFDAMSRVAVLPLLDLLRVLTREDLPVLKSVLRGAGEWELGIGEGVRDHAEIAAIDEALRSPWLSRGPEQARQAILLVGLPEADDKAAKQVFHYANVQMPRASILWGTFVDAQAQGARVTILVGH